MVIKIDGLGWLRGPACEPYSPMRRARRGQKRCGEQRDQWRM